MCLAFTDYVMFIVRFKKKQETYETSKTDQVREPHGNLLRLFRMATPALADSEGNLSGNYLFMSGYDA